jgi:hypothetical protein
MCDSQDLALHTVMSDGVATVKQSLGWGRRDGASLCKRVFSTTLPIRLVSPKCPLSLFPVFDESSID